jgi:uncharacterized coiled-coil protein SlyX
MSKLTPQNSTPALNRSQRSQQHPLSHVVIIMLGWLAALPMTWAVTPPPDGGYPNENTTGSNNIDIGNSTTGVAGEANTIRIGTTVHTATYVAGIYTNVQPIVGTDPDSVTITSTGRLGRGNVSSRRYKHDIKPMEKASEALYALKPVSFRYNEEYDATQTLAFGLIAEDVAEVYPDLVGRNPKGEPESVRYEAINAMLLNEFLKEHRQVQDLKSAVVRQEATIAQLKRGMEVLTARMKEQASQIQKVSGKVELSRPGPRTVANNQ